MEEIIINDYIKNDPLSEENLDITLDLVNEIRLSSQQKTIWLYTGYTWEQIFNDLKPDILADNNYILSEDVKRRIENSNIKQQIIQQCDVLIDGKYIDYQRDITLVYRGSKNQRVIDIQQSLQEGKVVLWCK